MNDDHPFAERLNEPATPPTGVPVQQIAYGHAGPPGDGSPKPAAKGKRRLITGIAIGSAVALVGGLTWFAVSQTASGGEDTPIAAAQNLTESVNSGDFIGLLNTLPPAESALFTEHAADATDELKRLDVLKADADPSALTGLDISAENIQFDESKTENVNDHVAITKIVSGKLTAKSDTNKLPLAKDLLDEALPDELDEPGQQQTFDIGDHVRDTGEPLRVATAQVNGEWYPSLLYTIADNVLAEEGEAWPTESVPAKGASSPNEAVRRIVQASIDFDVRGLIEVLPPDEMAVMHDVGAALAKSSRIGTTSSGTRILDLQTSLKPVTGGTRAVLSSLEVAGPRGESLKLAKDGSCYQVTLQGRTQRMCAEQLTYQFAGMSGRSASPEFERAMRNLASGLLKQGLGIVTTERANQYYVSPIRTLTEEGIGLLRSLQRGDIQALIRGH